MSLAKWSVLLVSTLGAALFLPRTALAQEPPLPALDAQPAGLPDAVFRSVGDRPVALQLGDGGEIVGRILSIEPGLIVVSVLPTNQVTMVPRTRVAQVRLLAAAPAPVFDREQPPVPAPPLHPRHFALNLSIAPGLDLDLDHGLFHGFANVGIVLPLASNGEIVPFSLGLGVGIPVAPRHPSLKLDLFAYVSVVGNTQTNTYAYQDTVVAFGAGLGLHHTWNNGLTLGFTVPILGYSVPTGKSSSNFRLSDGISYFYLASSESLPLGYIGYRF